MSSLCTGCKRSHPVLRAADLLNPYFECLNCGATFSLPAMRYSIDWTSRSSSKMPHDFDDSRAKAIEIARKGLRGESDVATVTDRWGIERNLTITKEAQIR